MANSRKSISNKKIKTCDTPMMMGGGAITLPVVTIERTGITKDPSRKGGFRRTFTLINAMDAQARMVIAKENQAGQNKKLCCCWQYTHKYFRN
jgi:hypothetical protein